MKKDKKHQEPNLTVKVNYPTKSLLSFARELQVRKDKRKKTLANAN